MSGPFGSTAWMANPSSGFYDFPITNSVRLGGTGHLTHTNGSDSASRQKFTFATWLKITSLSTAHHQLFDATNSFGRIYFTADDDGGNTVRVLMGDGSSNGNLVTTRKFRDTSSWYHIVVAVDTTEGTAGDRIKIYINGVRETSFAAETDVNQNVTTPVGGTALELIGAQAGPDTYFKGYLAETHYIVNAQLTPSSFGETKNDIWVPKDTAGLTYGTNGYRLQYKQTGTSANSSGIGADTSGNDNHWTPVNLVASDVMPDSPTNNFGTFNSIHDDTTGASTEVFSQGNLRVGESGNGWSNIFGSQGMPSGKWYWESYMAGSGTVDCLFGIAKSNWYIGSDGGLETAGAYTIYQHSNGNLYSWNNASQTNEGTTVTFTWDDILQVAYDADTGKLWFGKSNTWLFSGDPAAGSTPKMTIGASDIGDMLPAWSQYHPDNAWGVNFGQDSTFAGNETAQGNADGNGIGDFYYAPPSGFLALCTSNLPAPVATVDPAQGGSPQDYFNTLLWTGNAGTDRAISGLDFTPDLVWVKERTSTSEHQLTDSVRGVTKRLHSDNTGAETTSTNSILSFNTDGFNIGNSGAFNANGDTYASWSWKAGGSGVSNTDGSITSTVSANADTGFSIVSYTGTGSDGATVGHGLSSAPELAIIKGRDAGYPWMVMGYPTNTSFPNDGSFLTLSTTDAMGNGTGSEISIGSSTMTFVDAGGNICESSRDYIAYCFHSVDGYSKIGSYTGNGNADGTFVYTGFRPAFTMIKQSSGAGESWIMQDNKRSPQNVVVIESEANNAATEYSSDTAAGYRIDYLSNGFKIRNTNVNWNESGSTYIYMAFAEQPFKYSNAR
jgi:hypothetical protein